MPKPQPAAEPETSGYAGYKDFTDYINVHMALAGYNRDSLSQALGRTRTYISTICYGKDRAGRIKTPHYAPSPEMCDAIADLFMGEKATEAEKDGERHIVRVPAGKELRPPDAEARGLADQIVALSVEDRRFVTRIVETLGKAKRKKK